LVDYGNDGIVVSGMMGELFIMIDVEKVDLLCVVLDVVGDCVMVIVGVGINDIWYMIEGVKVVVDVGVYGLFVVILYYNKLF